MEREPTIEELINKITLLKKTLEYYADKKVYSGHIEKINILKDKGHQARFALEQIKKIDEYENEMIANLREILEGNEDITDEEKAEAIANMDKIRKSIDEINNG